MTTSGWTLPILHAQSFEERHQLYFTWGSGIDCGKRDLAWRASMRGRKYGYRISKGALRYRRKGRQAFSKGKE